jgi:alpha-1,2-mannosyltransferase
LIKRSTFVTVYLDPILYVLAAVAVIGAIKVAALPLEEQYSDFVTFWDNLRWYAGGHDLYTAAPRTTWLGPNLNPPALLLLAAPLAFLPLAVAQVTWMVISVALYAIVAQWVARELHLPAARILSVLLISQATFYAIGGGTFTAPIAACVTLAWRAHRHQRDRSAGIWIGAAIACKLFLLPFVAYAVVRRRWRMCGGIVIGMASVVILGVAVFGVSNTVLWIRTLVAVRPPMTSYPLNGSWMGWLARALWPDWSYLRAWWRAGSALIAALMLWQWSRADSDPDAEWIGILSGSLLASPLGWVYYAPLLVGPFAGRHRSALPWVSYGLFCVPFDLLVWSMSRGWLLTVTSAYFWGFLVLFIASLTPHSSGMTTRTDDGRQDSDTMTATESETLDHAQPGLASVR